MLAYELGKVIVCSCTGWTDFNEACNMWVYVLKKWNYKLWIRGRTFKEHKVQLKLLNVGEEILIWVCVCVYLYIYEHNIWYLYLKLGITPYCLNLIYKKI